MRWLSLVAVCCCAVVASAVPAHDLRHAGRHHHASHGRQQVVSESVVKTAAASGSSKVVSKDTLPVFPLATFLNHGYDRLQGDPLAAHDPGWRLTPVFDVACPTCFKSGNVFDDQYLLPDDVTVDHASACSYSGETFVVQDAKEFQREFTNSIQFNDLEIPLLKGFEFSGSKSFHGVLNMTAEEQLAVVYSRASCAAYQMQLDSFKVAMPLSDAFKAALQQLPSAILHHDLHALAQFVKTFGTHVISSIELGGMATQANVISKSNLTALVSGGVDLTAAAERSLWIFFGAQLSDTGSAAAQAYANMLVTLSDNTTFCRPSCPPTGASINLDSSDWARSLVLPRVASPVSVQLEPITSLLDLISRDESHPLELRGAAQDVMSAVAEFINTTYCSMTDGCQDPEPLPRWLPSPPMLTPREGAVAGTAGSVVYVAGGSDTTGLKAELESIDLDATAPEWVSRPSLPVPRTYAAGGMVGHTFVVAGGQDPDAISSNLVHLFDTQTFTWTAGPPMVGNHSHHAAAVSGGNLYVFSGYNTSAKLCSGASEVFNGTAWAAIAPAPVPTFDAAAVTAMDKTVLVIGGTVGATTSAVVQVYQPATNSWSVDTPPLPLPLRGARAFARAGINGSTKVSVFGGFTPDAAGNPALFPDVLEYDSLARTWTKQPRSFAPAFGPAVTTYGDHGIVVGGSSAKAIATSVIGENFATSSAPKTSQAAAAAPKQQPRPQKVLVQAAPVKAQARPAATPVRAAADATPLPSMPNVQELGRGIDMVHSDPDSLAANPGLRQYIFDFECADCYSQGKQFDSTFKVPDFVSARPDRDCSYDASVDEIHNTLDLQKHFSFYVHSRKCFLFFCSSHTESFNEVERLTANSEHVLVKAKATCSAYTAELERSNQQGLGTRLSENFVSAVNQLPTAVDLSAGAGAGASGPNAELFRFAQTFGTHYIVRATLGGSAVQTTVFNQSSFASMKSLSNSLNPVQYGAAVSFFSAFGGDAPGSYTQHEQSYKQFKASATSQTTSFIPQAPPRRNDTALTGESWLDSVSAAPGLVAFETEVITDLLTPALIPGMDAGHLAQVRSALNTYLVSPQGYCHDMGGCSAATPSYVWQGQQPMLQPRSQAAASLLNNSVYFLAGAEGPDDAANVNAALMFDSHLGNWSYLPPKPFNASTVGAGAAVFEDDIFSLGGLLNGKCDSSVAKYSPAKREWIAVRHMLQPRCDFVAVAFGQNVYAMGGTDGTNMLNTVERYTPETNMWSLVQPMPTARSKFAATIYNNELWTLGGLDANQAVSAAVEVYNFATDAWRSLPPIPAAAIPRAAHQAVVFPTNDQAGNPGIWLLGGMASSDPQDGLDDTHVYDLVEKSWAQGPRMYMVSVDGSAIVASAYSNATSSESKAIHYFGGVRPDGSISNDHVALVSQGDAPAQQDIADTAEAKHAAAASRRRRRVVRAPVASPKVSPTSTTASASSKPTSSKPTSSLSLTAPVVPGVSYLGFGFNMVTGDPTSGLAGSDGWASQRVFDPLCATCVQQNRTVLGGNYTLPDGLSMSLTQSCTVNTKTAVIKDGVDLQVWLRDSISASAHAWLPFLARIHFSANANFQHHTELTVKDKSVSVAASATCESHRVGFDPYSYRLPITDAFADAVANLPPASSSASAGALATFFNTFGTHVPRSVVLGGRATVHNRLMEATYSSLEESDINFDASAHAHFLFFFGMSASAGGSIHYRRFETMNHSTTDTTTACMPTCPARMSAPQVDTSKWAATVQLAAGGQPVPVAADWMLVTDIVAAINQTAGTQLQSFLQSGYCSNTPGCLAVNPLARPAKSKTMNVPRAGHQLVVRNKTLSVLGGVGGTAQPLAVVEAAPLLSQPEAPWGYSTPLPAPRFNFAAATVGSTTIVAGGETGVILDSTLLYDGDLWTNGPRLPNPRTGAAPVVVGDALYLFFGLVTSATWTNAVWLNTTTMTWTNGTGLAPSFVGAGAAAAAIGGQVFVLGGQLKNGISSTVLSYDIATDRFTEMQAHLPTYRAFHVATAYGQHVFVAGGVETTFAGGVQTLASSILKFDPVLQTFTEFDTLPVPRQYLAATLVDSTWVLAGGVTDCDDVSTGTKTGAVTIVNLA